MIAALALRIHFSCLVTSLLSTHSDDLVLSNRRRWDESRSDVAPRELLTAAMDERLIERKTAKDVGGEAPLSVVLLARLVPVDGRELENAVSGPAGQEAQEVAQVCPGLDVVEPAAGEQRDEGRVDVAGVVAADEEPVAPADDFSAQGGFAPVVVRRQATVLEKALECVALV